MLMSIVESVIGSHSARSPFPPPAFCGYYAGAMLDEIAVIVATEIVSPVFRGYFPPAGTPEIRRWKWAAWLWLWGSIACFFLASWLAHPIGVGLAIGVGVFAVIASFVSSASASVLRKRIEGNATTTKANEP